MFTKIATSIRRANQRAALRAALNSTTGGAHEDVKRLARTVGAA